MIVLRARQKRLQSEHHAGAADNLLNGAYSDGSAQLFARHPMRPKSDRHGLATYAGARAMPHSLGHDRHSVRRSRLSAGDAAGGLFQHGLRIGICALIEWRVPRPGIPRHRLTAGIYVAGD